MKKLLYKILIACISFIVYHSELKANSSLSGKFKIRGEIENVTDGDSISVFVWSNLLTDTKRFYLPFKKQTVCIKSGKFTFDSQDISTGCYISLYLGIKKPYVPIMDFYYCEPGDNVSLKLKPKDSTFKNWIIGFNGLGSEKFKCKYELLLNNEEKFYDIISPIALAFNGRALFYDSSKVRDGIDFVFNGIDIYKNNCLKIIDSCKKYMAASTYQAMKLDLISEFEGYKLRFLREYFNESMYKYHKVSSRSDIELFRTYILSLLNDFAEPSFAKKYTTQLKSNSKKYLSFLRDRAAAATQFSLGPMDSYFLLKRYPQSTIRDRIIAGRFLEGFDFMRNTDSVVSDAMETVKEDFSRSLIEKVVSAKMKGLAAFDFSLQDTSGKWVRLSDFKGKVVFIDFWYNSCSACMKYYLHNISKAENFYEKDPRVVFITVNADYERGVWLDGIYDGMHTSPKIINLTAGNDGFNSSVLKHYFLTSYPWPLLIDKNGKIFENNESSLRDISDDSATKLINRIGDALKEL